MTSRPLRSRLAVLAAVAIGLVAAGTATAATSITRDVSSNWAGYVVSGTTFSSVTGTWVQPALLRNGSFVIGAARRTVLTSVIFIALPAQPAARRGLSC